MKISNCAKCACIMLSLMCALPLRADAQIQYETLYPYSRKNISRENIDSSNFRFKDEKNKTYMYEKIYPVGESMNLYVMDKESDLNYILTRARNHNFIPIRLKVREGVNLRSDLIDSIKESHGVNFRLYPKEKSDGYTEYVVMFVHYFSKDRRVNPYTTQMAERRLNTMIEKSGMRYERDTKMKILRWIDYTYSTTDYDSETFKNGDIGKIREEASFSQLPLYKISMCYGYTSALKRIMDKLNIPNYIAEEIHKDDALHVVVRAKIDGRWQTIEATPSMKSVNYRKFQKGRNRELYREVYKSTRLTTDKELKYRGEVLTKIVPELEK